MKTSIKHLPRKTQRELDTLVHLIVENTPSCQMVILFGSYARGGYVIWDETITDGIRETYQSDYDILVVVDTPNTDVIEQKLNEKTTSKYNVCFKESRHVTPPEFIVEEINSLNKQLQSNQYFYTDIIKEGIKLYDTTGYKIAKPRKLSYQERQTQAIDHFKSNFPKGNQYLKHSDFDFIDGDYVTGSFEAHQATEHFYKTIFLVFTLYRPKYHKLDKLGNRSKRFSRDLGAIFPQHTDFEKRCFDLLQRAYIEARYNRHFVVTKEELEYMIARVEVLKEITECVCQERLAWYGEMVEKECLEGTAKIEVTN